MSIRSDCRPLPTQKITIFIKNLLNDTQELKRAKRDPLKTLALDTSEFDERIKEITQQTAKLISGEIVTAQEAKDAETEVEESDDVE